jgi:hypothetical protein
MLLITIVGFLLSSINDNYNLTILKIKVFFIIYQIIVIINYLWTFNYLILFFYNLNSLCFYLFFELFSPAIKLILNIICSRIIYVTLSSFSGVCWDPGWRTVLDLDNLGLGKPKRQLKSIYGRLFGRLFDHFCPILSHFEPQIWKFR